MRIVPYLFKSGHWVNHESFRIYVRVSPVVLSLEVRTLHKSTFHDSPESVHVLNLLRFHWDNVLISSFDVLTPTDISIEQYFTIEMLHI